MDPFEDELESLPDLNPYQAPESEERGGQRFAFGLYLALAMGTLLQVGALSTRGHLLELYAEFDLPLPTITKISMSIWFLVVVAGLMVFTLAKEWFIPGRQHRQILNVAMIGLLGLCGLIYMNGALLPLIGTIQSLSE